MGKVKRDIAHYEVYTLYAIIRKVLGKRGGKEITRDDRVAVAVFDDMDLLVAYRDGVKAKQAGQIAYEEGTDLFTEEPVASHFSLPFNPSPEPAAEEADTTKTTE